MATAVAPRMFKKLHQSASGWNRGAGKCIRERNPANTDELIGLFVSSNSEAVDAAVEAATKRTRRGGLVPAPKRAEICFARRSCSYSARKILEGHDARNGQGPWPRRAATCRKPLI